MASASSSALPEPIPQPEQIVLESAPPAPPVQPLHSEMMVVRLSGYDELAVVHKRSYRWKSGAEPQRLSEDEPLRQMPEVWPEKVDERGPSYRGLVDAHAWRTGVDVLVRGTARAARSVGQLPLAVRVGDRVVTGIAWGQRRIERRGNAWAFSEPEPFTELTLRDEWAYGGSDAAAEARIIAQAVASMTPEQRRRAGPSVQGLLGSHRPLAYPRNPYGLGYVLDGRPEDVVGRALPRLERSDDVLTPARLVLPAPFAWVPQPLPFSWSGLPPYAFPRIAMAGAPPSGYEPGAVCPEITRGWLPQDFCRGNIHSTSPQDLPRLLHPDYVRNADPALRFAQLAAATRIELNGFSGTAPALVTTVPHDRPLAEHPDPSGRKEPVLVPLVLHEVVIDADQQQMHVIFAGRTRLERPLTPAVLAHVAAGLRIREGGR